MQCRAGRYDLEIQKSSKRSYRGERVRGREQRREVEEGVTSMANKGKH